ncbi:MAG: hypothetical protein C3F18_01820, partial [Nitrosomonadales bacterium]
MATEQRLIMKLTMPAPALPPRCLSAAGGRRRGAQARCASFTLSASRIIPYRLPLRAEWASAQGSFAERRGWLLRLETDAGLIGWGDCAPLPEHDAAGELDALGQALAGLDLEAARQRLSSAQLHPAVRCAADV